MPGRRHHQHAVAHPQIAGSDLHRRHVAAVARHDHELAHAGAGKALADVDIGADRGCGGQRQRAGKRLVLVGLAELHDRQERHRQGGRAGFHERGRDRLARCSCRRRAADGARAAPPRRPAARRSSAAYRHRRGPSMSFPSSDVVATCPGYSPFKSASRNLVAATGENAFMPPRCRARNRISIAAIAVAAASVIVACLSPGNAALAQPLDKISFGTNWVAEGEHGGFYQAVADGTYRKYGLDVTIVPGGPQVNNQLLLAAADRLLHGREHAAVVRRGGAEHPDDRRRRDVPERPAGHDRPPRPGHRQIARSQGADALHLGRKASPPTFNGSSANSASPMPRSSPTPSIRSPSSSIPTARCRAT